MLSSQQNLFDFTFFLIHGLIVEMCGQSATERKFNLHIISNIQFLEKLLKIATHLKIVNEMVCVFIDPSACSSLDMNRSKSFLSCYRKSLILCHSAHAFLLS